MIWSIFPNLLCHLVIIPLASLLLDLVNYLIATSNLQWVFYEVCNKSCLNIQSYEFTLTTQSSKNHVQRSQQVFIIGNPACWSQKFPIIALLSVWSGWAPKGSANFRNRLWYYRMISACGMKKCMQHAPKMTREWEILEGSY